VSRAAVRSHFLYRRVRVVVCSCPVTSVHASFCFSPKRLSKSFLIGFCGGRFRNFYAKLNGLWGFHAAEARLAMCNDEIFGDCIAVAQDYDCFYGFAPFVVGDADDGAFADFGKLHDGGFDFGAIDVEAATDDHVFFSVDYVEETRLVSIADVAGVVPTEGANLVSGFRKLVVAEGNQRASGDDFSGLMWGENASFVVHHCETNSGARASTASQALRMITGGGSGESALIEPSEEHGRFGLSVALAKAGAKDLDASFQFVGRDRRGGQQENAQA